jgi:hypothetical protein
VTTVGPDSGVFSAGAVPGPIAASLDASLDVIFVPPAPRVAYAATLQINSNDPDRPVFDVPLEGIGGVHEIEVFPPEVDFGLVDEGSEPIRTVEIRNIGGDVLDISSVTWTSTSGDLAPTRGFFAGGRVAAKSSTVVEIVYAPTDLGADFGTLTIASNDDDEPEVVVPVRGRANLAPRAIAWGCRTVAGQIGCAGVDTSRRFTLGVGERVGLDGRESADPEGQEIASYSWVLVTSPPNALPVFHTTDDINLRQRATGDLEVASPGRHDVRLIVKDARGLESLDTPESHVLLAPRDLEVLLRWDIETDVDLHLVHPGGRVGDYGTGRAGTSTGSDCSTYNRAPNWRDLSVADDDPQLDIDVVSGRGPEIVGLNAPVSGQPYSVFAHYCDSQNRRVPVNVVMEVFVRGVRVQQVPMMGRTFTLAPGEAWNAAELVWDEGPPAMVTVRPMADVSPVAMPELCRL